MRSASQNETRILLGMNILVDFALNVIHKQLSKEERAAAEFARKLVLLSDCKLLIPEIAVSVEFPRAFSRAVLEHHVTNEDKLRACLNMLRIHRAHLESCRSRDRKVLGSQRVEDRSRLVLQDRKSERI
jgi:hypothetical protein